MPADCTAAEGEDAKAVALAYMESVLKDDVRPLNRVPPAPAPKT